MKKTHALSRALLGIWVCTLFAFVPASGTDEKKTSDGPTERPAWAQSSHAPSKSNYSWKKFKVEADPAEWEFIGYTAKELHDRFDKMSPCEAQPTRFWFHACGGIEGGSFIEVKYGADGKVTEAWYCHTGCTYTDFGKHFSDKTEALKHSIERTTKKLQEDLTRKSAVPSSLSRQLKTRAKAYEALGKTELAKRDLKRAELLVPIMERYENAGNVLGGTIYAPLDKLSKEFERNGFQTMKLSSSKYKFFKPNGASCVVTANGRQIVKAEEAIWLLHEEIEKEAIKVIGS